ncbi:MAG: GntR family transcriptional regulator [Proteobacteria bacterium]|nr:GntR family transcriptional regulator [Pseudomonadota bacterium]
MNIIDTISTDTKAEQIYRKVKAAILKGEILPGEKLVINQLAAHFKTSAIPVREALGRLEAVNLIVVVPHTGAHVKGIDIECLRELYPVRGVLEGYAVRLATEKITTATLEALRELIHEMETAGAAKDFALMGKLNIRFHRTIYAASENKTLINMIDDLWEKTAFARLVFKFTPFRAKDSNKEHKLIVEALAANNPKRAEKLIVRQSDKTLILLDRYLKKKKG